MLVYVEGDVIVLHPQSINNIALMCLKVIHNRVGHLQGALYA